MYVCMYVCASITLEPLNISSWNFHTTSVFTRLRWESPSCSKTNCSKTSCLKTEYRGAERIEPWWAWCIILPTSNPILKSQNFFFPFLMPSGNFIIMEFHTKNSIIVFSNKNTYFQFFFSNSLLIINYYNLKNEPF